jgi:hypothetical protein
MAGILDEVMDGITAKEKQGGQTPPATTSAQEQTQPDTSGAKPMNAYSNDFKNKYGEKKNT